jgi:hypothetical protein
VAIRDFDMAPAFERRKHHEEVGGPVALVFVVENDPGAPTSSALAMGLENFFLWCQHCFASQLLLQTQPE